MEGKNMFITNCIEELYDETFDSVYGALAGMIRQEPEQAEQRIRGILKNLYIRQGNDWTGRGAIGNAAMDASISAYESILHELTFSKVNSADLN